MKRDLKNELKVVVNNSNQDDHDHYFVGGVMQEQIDKCSNQPRRQLFGPFVLERQLNVLVGQTAAGKSVLMVQVLRGIASEEYDAGFPCEASPLKCCYIDCENDTDDWRDRMNGERLPDNIIRKTLDATVMFEDLAEIVTGKSSASTMSKVFRSLVSITSSGCCRPVSRSSRRHGSFSRHSTCSVPNWASPSSSLPTATRIRSTPNGPLRTYREAATSIAFLKAYGRLATSKVSHASVISSS